MNAAPMLATFLLRVLVVGGGERQAETAFAGGTFSSFFLLASGFLPECR
jgi:hypothetical protein